MKPAVLWGIAFAVGLAGSTGAMVARGRKATPADSAHAAPHGEHADSVAVKRDSTVAKPAADSAAPAPVKAGHDSAAVEVAPAAAVPRQVDAASAPARSAVAPAPEYPRLARIFAAMPAAQSVELLGHMNDDDVEGIIRSLGVRQQAAIMAALPKDRAAAMSKRLLVPRDTVGAK